jgi:SAM-dependent methyltransferase
VAQADLSLPPEEQVKSFVGGDHEEFLAAGNQWLRYFIETCKLQPDERVLDFGCGLGRVAIPLSRYLAGEGSYEGLDVAEEAIRWCQDSITSRYPNFRFQHVDLYNGTYNPAGRMRPSDYTFPYRDEAFDFVVLTSVFTHMFPDDMAQCFSEIRRVLKKGKRWLASYYLLNDESIRHMRDKNTVMDRVTEKVLTFELDHGVYSLRSPRPPHEDGLAYREDFLLALYEHFGFEASVDYGKWAHRENASQTNLDDQDVIVAVRR